MKIKVGFNQGLKEEWEGQNARFLKPSETFCQSAMVLGAMSSEGFGLLFHQNQSQCSCLLEHTMLPSADSTKTTNWFADHETVVLDWPASLSDLNPIENIWSVVKCTMKNT